MSQSGPKPIDEILANLEAELAILQKGKVTAIEAIEEEKQKLAGLVGGIDKDLDAKQKRLNAIQGDLRKKKGVLEAKIDNKEEALLKEITSLGKKHRALSASMKLLEELKRSQEDLAGALSVSLSEGWMEDDIHKQWGIPAIATRYSATLAAIGSDAINEDQEKVAAAVENIASTMRSLPANFIVQVKAAADAKVAAKQAADDAKAQAKRVADEARVAAEAEARAAAEKQKIAEASAAPSKMRSLVDDDDEDNDEDEEEEQEQSQVVANDDEEEDEDEELEAEGGITADQQDALGELLGKFKNPPKTSMPGKLKAILEDDDWNDLSEEKQGEVRALLGEAIRTATSKDGSQKDGSQLTADMLVAAKSIQDIIGRSPTPTLKTEEPSKKEAAPTESKPSTSKKPTPKQETEEEEEELPNEKIGMSLSDQYRQSLNFRHNDSDKRVLMAGAMTAISHYTSGRINSLTDKKGSYGFNEFSTEMERLIKKSMEDSKKHRVLGGLSKTTLQLQSVLKSAQTAYAIEMANTVTKMHSRLLQTVPTTELFNPLTEGGKRFAKSVTSLGLHVNLDILSVSSMEELDRKMKHWIDVMNECQKKNNYAGVMAIEMALGSTSVGSAIKFSQHLEEYKKILEEHNASNAAHMKVIRNAMDSGIKEKKPVIPYSGSYTRPIAAAEEMLDKARDSKDDLFDAKKPERILKTKQQKIDAAIQTVADRTKEAKDAIEAMKAAAPKDAKTASSFEQFIDSLSPKTDTDLNILALKVSLQQKREQFRPKEPKGLAIDKAMIAIDQYLQYHTKKTFTDAMQAAISDSSAIEHSILSRNKEKSKTTMLLESVLDSANKAIESFEKSQSQARNAENEKKTKPAKAIVRKIKELQRGMDPEIFKASIEKSCDSSPELATYMKELAGEEGFAALNRAFTAKNHDDAFIAKITLAVQALETDLSASPLLSSAPILSAPENDAAKPLPEMGDDANPDFLEVPVLDSSMAQADENNKDDVDPDLLEAPTLTVEADENNQDDADPGLLEVPTLDPLTAEADESNEAENDETIEDVIDLDAPPSAEPIAEAPSVTTEKVAVAANRGQPDEFSNTVSKLEKKRSETTDLKKRDIINQAINAVKEHQSNGSIVSLYLTLKTLKDQSRDSSLTKKYIRKDSETTALLSEMLASTKSVLLNSSNDDVHMLFRAQLEQLNKNILLSSTMAKKELLQSAQGTLNKYRDLAVSVYLAKDKDAEELNKGFTENSRALNELIQKSKINSKSNRSGALSNTTELLQDTLDTLKVMHAEYIKIFQETPVVAKKKAGATTAVEPSTSVVEESQVMTPTTEAPPPMPEEDPPPEEFDFNDTLEEESQEPLGPPPDDEEEDEKIAVKMPSRRSSSSQKLKIDSPEEKFEADVADALMDEVTKLSNGKLNKHAHTVLNVMSSDEDLEDKLKKAIESIPEGVETKDLRDLLATKARVIEVIKLLNNAAGKEPIDLSSPSMKGLISAKKTTDVINALKALDGEIRPKASLRVKPVPTPLGREITKMIETIQNPVSPRKVEEKTATKTEEHRARRKP